MKWWRKTIWMHHTFIPVLATRCLYWGVHLTWACLTVNVKLTLHLTVNSRWPDVLLLLATRCLYWGGVHLTWACLTRNVKLILHLTVNVKLTWCSTTLGHQMPLWGGHLTWACLTVNVKQTLHLSVNVKLTWSTTTLGHQMPLPEGVHLT